MAKYLVQASYTADGLKGLMKDKGSGRVAAVKKAVSSLGGKLECFYFAFGEHDAFLIVDVPDNVAAAALSIRASAAGLARTRVTSLLTAAEVDQAVEKEINYKAPGQ